jgi:hypothetical protein
MCFGNNRTSPKGDRKSREGDGSCHRREDNQAVCGMCAGENLFLEFAPMSSKHLSHSSSLLLTGGGGGVVWLPDLRHRGAVPHRGQGAWAC